jgi:SSS family solute:Na+ symporter
MSGSIGLTKSFYKVIVPKATEKQQLIASKLFIILLSLIGLIFTISGGGALALLNIMSYSLITQLAPAMFFSFSKNNLINKYGAMTGIVTGVLIVLYATIFNIKIATFFPTVSHTINDISTGAIALLINIVITIIVSIATKNIPIEKEQLTQVKTS